MRIRIAAIACCTALGALAGGPIAEADVKKKSDLPEIISTMPCCANAHQQ